MRTENHDLSGGKGKALLFKSLDSFSETVTLEDDNFSTINLTQIHKKGKDRMRLYSLNFLNEEAHKFDVPESTPEDDYFLDTPHELVSKSEYK
jgi:hypothetical protein